MKAKKFAALMTSVFGLAAIGLTISLAIGQKGLNGSFLTRAGTQDTGSYTITAADFANADANGNGSLTVGGETWNYQKAAVVGDVVTISDVFYTSTKSGATVNAGRRGDGYTRMVFDGLDVSSSVGLVFYLKDVNDNIKHTVVDVQADKNIKVINEVAIPSAERRGVHFAQGVGSSFSFASLTMYYDCSDVVPQVQITTNSLSVGVGENGNIETTNIDVYSGDVVSYSWSSDDDMIATVSGNTSTGVVTGVAAGTTEITVTMNVNGANYTDTIEVTVTQAAAEVIKLAVLDTTRIQGAGIFCNLNPSSASVTAAYLNGLARSADIEFVVANDNAINYVNYQDTLDNSYTAYVVMNSAVGLNGQFSVKVDFRDNALNKVYRAMFYFDQGAVAPEIVLSPASLSVEEGDTLQVTASKNFYLDGVPTFVFESLDTSVITVVSNGANATITGEAEGTATLRVTMTISEDTYVLEKTVAVTAAGVQNLITWYTEGTGNQANHWQGAGIWTWIDYGALGYDWSGISTKKSSVSVSYNPSVSLTVDVISDDINALHVCRIYIVAASEQHSGTLTMSLPDSNGVTYTGTIQFNAGVAVAYNGVAV